MSVLWSRLTLYAPATPGAPFIGNVKPLNAADPIAAPQIPGARFLRVTVIVQTAGGAPMAVLTSENETLFINMWGALSQPVPPPVDIPLPNGIVPPNWVFNTSGALAIQFAIHGA